jgi:hypothetical protein
MHIGNAGSPGNAKTCDVYLNRTLVFCFDANRDSWGGVHGENMRNSRIGIGMIVKDSFFDVKIVQ